MRLQISAFVLCCVVVGCEDPSPPNRSIGSAIFALHSTAPNGDQFRLASATMSIKGPQNVVLDVTETSPETLYVDLEPGDYSVDLAPDWNLQRHADGEWNDVPDAKLVSPSHVEFKIDEGIATAVTYTFGIGETIIPFGKGQLVLGIDTIVAEPPLDPETAVRDVSNAPILWDIAGVGRFRANGMSRLAWIVDVIETPSTPPRVLRDPGAWRIPPVTVTQIEAVGSSNLAALADWVENPVEHDATVTLFGRAGEMMVVVLDAIFPTQGDTTISDGRLADLVVSVPAMSVPTQNYQQASPAPLFVPSTVVEVPGIFNEVGFRPEDIDELAAESSGYVRLRSIQYQQGSLVQPFQAVLWMQTFLQYIDMVPPTIDRKAMGLSHVDANYEEISGVNCYEVWPNELYLFNPAKDYPYVSLVDVSIAVEFSVARR